MQPSSSLSIDEQRRLRAERDAALRLKNNKLGLTIFQASWILVFVALIIVYWQLGFTEGWRPTAAQKPDFMWPTLATASLLASTYFAWSALRELQQKAKPGTINTFQSRWLAAIGTGAVFLMIMIQQAINIANPEGTQYASIYRVMIGYHAIHAFIIGIMLIQVYRYSQYGRYNADNTWTAEAAARLWYFVTVAWLMFYVVLYLI